MSLLRVSVTGHLTFRDCHRRWLLSDLEGLSPKTPQIAPWLGQGMHEALGAYYHLERHPQILLDTFDHWYEAVQPSLEQDFGMLWSQAQQEFHQEYLRGREILRWYSYYDYENPVFGRDWKIRAIETTFEIPIRTLTGRRTQAILAGRLDLVIENSEGIWVVDHKIYENKPSLKTLDLDDQATGYLYLLWRATGEVPRGVIFNILLKKSPQEPVVLKDGSLSRDRSQPTLYSLYLKSLRDKNLDEAKYTEILSHLQLKGWSDFFMREGTVRGLTELESFEKRLYREYSEMRAIEKDRSLAYPNFSFQCGWCPFEPVCKVWESGEDVEAVVNSLYTSREKVTA